jgi:3-hydroxyacyl-[acyl-carrier-protein] dehydratase
MGQPIVDLTSLDLSKNVIEDAEIRACLPHAEYFRLLDGVCHYDAERKIAIGYKDWEKDPWWAAGHVPGRPLMPGVLMIEGAAQIATFLVKQVSGWAKNAMIGLAGLDDVRIRGQIGPGSRVHFVAGNLQLSGRRLARMHAQVFCNGQMTLEAFVMGVML